MPAFLLAAFASALVPLVSSGTATAQGSGGSRGDGLVRVELFADRAAVHPGEAFTLAAKLTVEPGWHIYWENPGDSGLPTRIRLAGPEGFAIAAPLHPAPRREVAEGDIVTFVHEGEVLFLADAVAPKEPTPDSKAAFELEASWLVCKETCYPGSGKARLVLPFAGGGAPIPANEKYFAAARTKLPRPWKELAGASLEWSGSGEARALSISVSDPTGATGLELFPHASKTTSVEELVLDRSAGSCRITARLRFREPSPAEPPRLSGVLVVRSARGETPYRFDSTWDRSPGEPHPLPKASNQ